MKHNYLKNEDGNVAVISAIAFPIVALIGFCALDYGLLESSDQELRAAASAAALAAANEAHIVYTTRELGVDLEQLIEDTAKKTFAARTADLTHTDIYEIEVTPHVTNNVFSVDVQYKANYKTQAMGITGRDTFTIANTQSATVAARSYINFNFLFDISASMGVGATIDDMEIMKDEIGCAFSCHINKERGESSYDKARAAGATMRIDVARDAAKDAIDIMIEKSEVPDHMTVSLHTYDNIYTPNVPVGDEQTSNLPLMKTLVDDAVQMRMEYGGSNTELGLKQLVETLPASGSGRTADDRIQYVIVLTDGVENPQNWRSGAGWTMHEDAVLNSPYEKFATHEYEYAPNANSCDGAHDKNIQVFFINTEYLVPNWTQSSHNTARFGFIEDTLHDLIPVRMADCAGRDDNVIYASSPDEIKDAFKNIIGELSSPLRLF